MEVNKKHEEKFRELGFGPDPHGFWVNTELDIKIKGVSEYNKEWDEYEVVLWDWFYGLELQIKLTEKEFNRITKEDILDIFGGLERFKVNMKKRLGRDY